MFDLPVVSCFALEVARSSERVSSSECGVMGSTAAPSLSSSSSITLVPPKLNSRLLPAEDTDIAPRLLCRDCRRVGELLLSLSLSLGVNPSISRILNLLLLLLERLSCFLWTSCSCISSC